jgi:hypothetical protein
MDIDELVKDEIRFCESQDCEKNEHGVYAYRSDNELHMFNLPHYLSIYKEWLIEQGIVKEV